MHIEIESTVTSLNCVKGTQIYSILVAFSMLPITTELYIPSWFTYNSYKFVITVMYFIFKGIITTSALHQMHHFALVGCVEKYDIVVALQLKL